ncbi:MAG TPA: hypothetical protein VLE22_17960 [Bryobacteraceae bacterium]|jgi:hypothetical protein|nr:hypothetical protein [Bryobacteraceae bacterium]
MKIRARCPRTVTLLAFMALLAAGQIAPPGQEPEPRLPSGKSQREAILKEEYAKTLADAGRLVELAESLKIELEKNDRHVLSVSSLKKAEELEKLAKRIRNRLKRF